MDLIFRFLNNEESPISIPYVFQRYYRWFVENNPQINVILDDVSKYRNEYAGCKTSGFFFTIENPDTQKYIVVSYWDRSEDLKLKTCGWNYENCVELICSCGVNDKSKYTPFTYIFDHNFFYDTVEDIRKPFSEKKNQDLLFRGRMYGYRKILNNFLPNIVSEIILPPLEYLSEINDRKVSLSLNGVAEICHRDLEIMSLGSVLFRPELKVQFHNPLIPWTHYIPFDFDLNNSIEDQWEIIDKRFQEVRNNDQLLSKISKNAIEWFYQNGTINANFELLKKLIKIEKLL